MDVHGTDGEVVGEPDQGFWTVPAGPVGEPDRVLAAEELTRLRDGCAEAVAAGRAFDVPGRRRAAAALIRRAMAEDTIVVTRAGLSVPVTIRGPEPGELGRMDFLLRERYRPRSLSGWVVGTVLGFVFGCSGFSLNRQTEAQTGRVSVFVLAYAVIACTVAVVCLIKWINAVGTNKSLLIGLIEERRAFGRAFDAAVREMAARSERTARARAEAFAVHADLVAILARADGKAPDGPP